jgi:hypothetical protein
MIRLLFNSVSIILLAPALFAFVYEGFLFVISVFKVDLPLWFIGGIALSLFVYVLFVWGKWDFVEHLLHELEHTLLYFLRTFRWPTRMEIDPEKGSKIIVTDGGCLLLLLAPYYFPLFTVPLLLVRALAGFALSSLETPWSTYVTGLLDLLIGATFVFHLACTFREFRFSRTDIKKTGRIASALAVVFLNAMFAVASVTVVTEAYAEFWAYLKAALPATQDAYQAVLDFAQTRVLPMASDWIQTLKDQFCLQCTPTPTP